MNLTRAYFIGRKYLRQHKSPIISKLSCPAEVFQTPSGLQRKNIDSAAEMHPVPHSSNFPSDYRCFQKMV